MTIDTLGQNQIGEAADLTCQPVTNPAEGDPLWSEWRALRERLLPEHRVHAPEWYRIWTETWGHQGQWVKTFRYVTARDREGVLRGILPVGSQYHGRLRVRALTGYDQPCRTVIAESGWEAPVGRAIADYVAGSDWNWLLIGPVRDTHMATQSFIEALRDKMALYVLRSHHLAVLQAPESWEDYRRDVLGSKFFRKLGYYERRTKRAGDMKIVHHHRPDEREIEAIFTDLATIESRSWLARNGDPRFIGKHAHALWTRLASELLVPSGYLDCWIMYLDSRPVSFCLTLTIGTARYVIANNFDESVKDHRTGSTLYRYMMENGFERGARTVDFGQTGLHYKSYWGATPGGLWATYLAFPGNAIGRMARLAFALGQVLTGARALRDLRGRLL